MDLDIIILIHNQLDVTKLCLKSIEEYTKVKYRVVVVDNNSNYTSEKWIRAFCKKNKIKLKYIKNKKNLGVSKGWNIGLRESSAEYIAILNNDIIVTPDWEINLIFTLHNLPDSLLAYPNSMQGDFTEENLIKDLKFSFGIEETEVFAGYCFIMKRRCLEEIGYFDERFTPFLCEDTDYAFRLLLNNTPSIKVYSSFILHFRSKTLDTVDYEDIREKNRNKLIDKYKEELKVDINKTKFKEQKQLIIKKINKRIMFLFDSIDKIIKIKMKEEKEIIKPKKEVVIDDNKINKKIMVIKKMYRIISPINFPSDKSMEHGTSKLFVEIPAWAKGNPRFVIEKTEVKIEEEEKTPSQTKSKTPKKIVKKKRKSTKKSETNFVCNLCKFKAKSKFGLQVHKRRKHS